MSQLITFSTVSWLWFTKYWQFWVGTIIAIALAVWPIVLYRRAKRLDWELAADESIYGMGALPVARRLSLRFDGLQLQNPRLITLYIVNTGAHEVRESDFTGTEFIKVSVPKAGTLAEASVAAVSNSRVFDVGRIDQALANVELRPKLMKPKDWLKLQLVVDGGDRPVVSGTFNGQTKPIRDRRDVTRQKLRWWRWGFLLVGIVAFVAAGIVSIRTNVTSALPGYILLIASFAFAAFMSTFVYSNAARTQPPTYSPRQ